MAVAVPPALAVASAVLFMWRRPVRATSGVVSAVTVSVPRFVIVLFPTPDSRPVAFDVNTAVACACSSETAVAFVTGVALPVYSKGEAPGIGVNDYRAVFSVRNATVAITGPDAESCHVGS